MKKLKILIADDNIIIAEQYKRFIEQNSNFKICGIALTAEEELKMIEEKSPEVVITDLVKNNDKTSSINIILKYEEIRKNIKFILITAYHYQEIFAKCNYRIPSNIIKYIAKPIINWNSLIQVLEEI